MVALAGLIVLLVLIVKHRTNKSDDWEINYDELEIGEQLGAGMPAPRPTTLGYEWA